jgi:WD40 repeat protein
MKRFRAFLVIVGLVFACRMVSAEIVPQRGLGGEILAVAFAPDAARFAVADGEVSVWRTLSGEREWSFDTDAFRMESLSWSPDGAQLAAGGLTIENGVWQGVICLWNAHTGQLLRRWMSGKASIAAVAFSPDGQTLATAGAGDFEHRENRGSVQLWDAKSGELRRTLKEILSSSAALRWSHDGTKIAVSFSTDFAGDRGVQVFDFDTGKALSDNPLSNDLSSNQSTNGIFTLTTQPDYNLKTENTTLTLRRATTGAIVAQMKLPSLVRRTALSNEGDYLLTGNLNNDPFKAPYKPALRVWRLDEIGKTWTNVRDIAVERNFATGVAATGDGSAFAVSNSAGVLALFDTKSGAPRAVVPNGTYDFNIALSRDGKLLAGSFLWDVSGAVPQKRLPLTGYRAVAFSPDGSRLVGEGGLVDTRSGKRIPMIARRESGDTNNLIGLQSASFSSEGRLLLTVDDTLSSQQLHLWDGVTGAFKRRMDLKEGGGDYLGVAFSARGTEFFAIGRFGWKLRAPSVIRRSSVVVADAAKNSIVRPVEVDWR